MATSYHSVSTEVPAQNGFDTGRNGTHAASSMSKVYPTENEKFGASFSTVAVGSPVIGPQSQLGHLKGLPAAFALLVVPVIGFTVWLPMAYRHGGQVGLKSVAVGGSLTQVQAKVIDVMCSALFAPLIIFCLSWHWFATARVTVLNEQSSKGVPLATLVETSKTEVGSYNPYKLYQLGKSRKPKMLLLASLVLIAAIALSAFSNVIAYEAFPAADSKVALATLHGLDDFGKPLISQMQGIKSYNFTSQQEASFARQALGVMTDITYQNATAELDQGAYIGINATQASLNALPPNITSLQEVPGYRLAIDCRSKTPDRIGVTQMGGYTVQVGVFFDSANTTTMYTGSFPGQMEIFSNGYSSDYTFVGFNTFAAESYLLFMSSAGGPAPQDSSTPYGPITTMSQNMTMFGFTGTQSDMNIWGFQCNFTRETGSHDLARNEDLSWTISNSTWSGDKSTANLVLADFQTDLNFHNPLNARSEPGLATAFRESSRVCLDPVPEVASPVEQPCSKSRIDWETTARNFLYSAGEVERIAYEIKNSANNTRPFEVQAVKTELRYRITYVPLILLVGLLALLFAALISLVLAFPHRQTFSYRTWRDVNCLRLLVDAVEGLRDEPSLKQVCQGSNDDLDDWAANFKVQYSRQLVDDNVSIGLSRDTNHH